ncbi:hypothetical protein EYF80_031629 [Liparis tanakae]|uniref:Uncharacterized protein n=1 Tax=Liparis tanakae TaxID=230148 RepID=A0A4Z2GXE3_9TELE|nr:hypothetical protein EYF80_031629 [Liparis tanakae]
MSAASMSSCKENHDNRAHHFLELTADGGYGSINAHVTAGGRHSAADRLNPSGVGEDDGVPASSSWDASPSLPARRPPPLARGRRAESQNA